LPSSRITNDFRFGWTWFPTAFDIPARENLNARFGIKGAVGAAFGQHDLGLAQFTPTAFTVIGSRCCWPNNDELTNYEFADNLLWLRGKHSLKFGVDYRFINKASLSARNNRGSFGFSGEYTAEFPNVAASRLATGNPMTDFLLGWASGGGSGTPARENTDYQYYGLYLRDDWRVTPKLTLNAGLRWELFAGPYYPHPEKELVTKFVLRGDPNYLGLDDEVSPMLNIQFQEWRIPNGEHDCGCRLDGNNFAPRLGLAYQPTKNTVLRAGVGFYYGFQDYLGIEDGRYYAQPPLVRDLCFCNRMAKVTSSSITARNRSSGTSERRA